MKKKTTKKTGMSFADLGELTAKTAFPAKAKAPEGFTDRVVEKVRKYQRQRESQLTMRVSPGVFADLRNCAETTGMKQVRIVEAALTKYIAGIREERRQRGEVEWLIAPDHKKTRNKTP